jgi:alpha-D-ribose 1-methylphosphonate 5-triphosphate diphosphatase
MTGQSDPLVLDLHITGADILWDDAAGGDVLGLRDGVIQDAAVGPAIHLAGWQVLPGIIDLHGDGFEHHLAPRRGAMKDLTAGFFATEAELAANGITTAYLAQFYSWEGGMRGPDFAARMLAGLRDFAPRVGTDMRAQLRVESHLIDQYGAIAALIAEHDVGYVVFNDHLPHDALARGKRPPRLTGQALKSGRSPEAHLALLQRLHDQGAAVPAALGDLARDLRGRGVVLGSHDDPDPETRRVARGQGMGISEFPETLEAAQAAQDAGDAVILGAPNVVRGGSHAGKVSAGDLARAGLCSALASDYHYPAPFTAAMHLAGDLGLAAAWALVSSGPASVLGLADRGRLAPGLRGDIIAVDPATGRPGLTIAGGRITYASGAGAAALVAARSRP